MTAFSPPAFFWHPRLSFFARRIVVFSHWPLLNISGRYFSLFFFFFFLFVEVPSFRLHSFSSPFFSYLYLGRALSWKNAMGPSFLTPFPFLGAAFPRLFFWSFMACRCFGLISVYNTPGYFFLPCFLCFFFFEFSLFSPPRPDPVPESRFLSH